jgi:hypothetical protein
MKTNEINPFENQNDKNKGMKENTENKKETLNADLKKRIDEEKSNVDSFSENQNNRFLQFLKKNKAATFLFVLLLIVIIWFFVKLRMNENKFTFEKDRIINKYENTIDSLKIKHLEFTTEVFSWSVRSELFRNNTENLNQLLTVFVRKSGADLVQIINPEDNIVLLSSDKKYEGIKYSGLLDFEMNSPLIIEEVGGVKIITPVMGFNTMIGILIVEVGRK